MQFSPDAQIVHDRSLSVSLDARPAPVLLTAADIPAILALLELTQPGPLFPGALALGSYLGVV